MTGNFCRYTMFCVLLSCHINIVFIYSVLVSLSRARDDHEISRYSVSQFSPLSVPVFSSAAPVSVDLLLAPVHAEYPLCELPRSLQCQSERIYWRFSLNRTGTNGKKSLSRQILMLAWKSFAWKSLKSLKFDRLHKQRCLVFLRSWIKQCIPID